MQLNKKLKASIRNVNMFPFIETSEKKMFAHFHLFMFKGLRADKMKKFMKMG